MGTRNLTIVKLNGKVKVAQYAQWDGYPTGQGKDIAKYLHSSKFDLKALKKAVAKLKWATKKEVADTWVKAGAEPDQDAVSFDVSDKHTKMFPEFSRDTGASILPMIQAGKVAKVENEHAFLKNSLFCEWAYMINLDTQTVSIYHGFQSTGKKDERGMEIFGKCKIIKRYKFENFTAKAMKELEDKIFQRGEEE